MACDFKDRHKLLDGTKNVSHDLTNNSIISYSDHSRNSAMQEQLASPEVGKRKRNIPVLLPRINSSSSREAIAAERRRRTMVQENLERKTFLFAYSQR